MRNLLFAALLLLAPTAAVANGLTVSLDEAVRVTLPEPAGDVIVGNPAIADVTVTDRRHLVITGKSYGVTNLVVADAAGRTILNREVVVSAADENRVSVFWGPVMLNYACAPHCQVVSPPTVAGMTASQAGAAPTGTTSASP
jgi:hypothetical protein